MEWYFVTNNKFLILIIILNGGKEKTHMINIYDDEDDVVGKDKNETNF